MQLQVAALLKRAIAKSISQSQPEADLIAMLRLMRGSPEDTSFKNSVWRWQSYRKKSEIGGGRSEANKFMRAKPFGDEAWHIAEVETGTQVRAVSMLGALEGSSAKPTSVQSLGRLREENCQYGMKEIVIDVKKLHTPYSVEVAAII